ncbi:hypothetical protein DSM106972_031060 [Dulcicalothrix desertica PCC 7102]|uniref:Uncharacterized protein n=1 Tax=Dulcicalothrix desertica PCC 7102 TaxID=232991 RepID=A0A433VIK5_9CYAN|nr:hypothetical protein [Dulcicalothrix desertica]RUT05900.1 hypothetical protein DSM106972_031060 [Dulcicalothrix desertica PCC 7102]TWH54403.1 hypothetical protein CAL7102_02434 [Dulcicalothrix desertica PCC 7102]
MGIFRPDFNGVGRSPSREIYGEKNGDLVAPIDICIFEFGDDSVVKFNQVDSLGDLVGAAVRNTSGAKIGTIKSFEAPFTSIDFKPVVFIELAEGLLTVPSSREFANPSEVSIGDSVSITIDGVKISGSVEKTVENYAYLKPGLQIQAYTVKFKQRLLDRAHGAAVVLNSSDKLLGMLIITDDNKREGTTQALVFPAHLI